MAIIEMPDAVVDCGSCTACCRDEIVPLTGDERPEDYPGSLVSKASMLIIMAMPDASGYHLPKAADGRTCAYLIDSRCSIYEKRPAVCRKFDCVGLVRQLLATTTRSERRQLMRTEVFQAGLVRLKAEDNA